MIDGRLYADALFDPDLDPILATISKEIGVRRAVANYHVAVIDNIGRIVVVGRDIACNVMPHATLHVFLWAKSGIREERRRRQVEEGRHGYAWVSGMSDQDIATRNIRNGKREWPSDGYGRIIGA
jgi:cytidylate kinase